MIDKNKKSDLKTRLFDEVKKETRLKEKVKQRHESENLECDDGLLRL